MRLDFFLSKSTGISRKEARRQIMAGRVTVDGTLCKKSATTVTADQAISRDDQALQLPGEHRYLMMNKPVDVVSATTDDLHTTALNLIPPEWRRDLHIAGRLDRDTTGLLLLTTDGQWSHRVTSPRSDCAKTYQVWLAEPLSEDAIQQLEAGILLKSETDKTAPAKVEMIAPAHIRLSITEGRYHQVKRMLAAVGNHVERLHRERIGAITLEPSLAPGEYRELTEAEINSF
ncbi:16S rRNA pseudouridine(516) synthase RsuA [Marinobacter sp. BGYM27]|uniref:16S rRNA pseudouridine(516) synthase RsuA n=1 Tax=Marinobacter sp. BGYM27 TaxID=2975597 RepID=UPI0021A57149|nr:16S rRNA pseudouridine(516) synthase RsuA [Marinobacter sp. BGYM27]MDG5501036.1 16S rRNA pseudouridine(516) synthase RsuA [Marinobacter sp. BGYM27]